MSCNRCRKTSRTLLALLAFPNGPLAAILLLDGERSIIATCSRVLLVIYAVVYAATDTLIGLGSGTMISFEATLPAERAHSRL